MWTPPPSANDSSATYLASFTARHHLRVPGHLACRLLELSCVQVGCVSQSTMSLRRRHLVPGRPEACAPLVLARSQAQALKYSPTSLSPVEAPVRLLRPPAGAATGPGPPPYVTAFCPSSRSRNRPLAMGSADMVPTFAPPPPGVLGEWSAASEFAWCAMARTYPRLRPYPRSRLVPRVGCRVWCRCLGRL